MAPNLVDCVIHWKKKLEKYSDETTILEVIRKLSKISITPEILEATHIGKTIRNLSKRNDNVGEKTKVLLSKWRKICVDWESSKDSKQKRISCEDNVKKSSSKQSLTQENIYNKKTSFQEEREKHKKESLHMSSSKQPSGKYHDSKSSSKSSQSLYESEIKKSHLKYDCDNLEARMYKKSNSPETFSSADKIAKGKTSSSRDSPELSSLKRKSSTEVPPDTCMNPKKFKSEKHTSTDSKDNNIHVSKEKPPNFKKEHLKSKESKQNSSSHVKKDKIIQSSEEFTSSHVSFEDCLGFNDIVTAKKKKSSKSQSSKKRPLSDSVQFNKKTSSKKVTDNDSPCEVSLPTESLCSSKGKISSSISKKSSMFDAAKTNSLFLSDMQSFKKEKTNNEDVIKFTSSRKEKTAIYSGRKIFNKGIPSLAQCCYRVLIENIDILGPMSDTPYSLLKPVLEKCTPNQLFTIEKYNPHLLDDTNELWEIHCKRDYKLLSPLEHETWRDVYLRGFDEREEKLKNITANISASMMKATPVRQVKLAFIDSDVKPPRDVLRRQAKSRQELASSALKPGLHSKVSAKKTAAVSHPVESNPSCVVTISDSVKTKNESCQNESFYRVTTKPVDPVVELTASSKDIANFVPKKPKVAPLMAKTLKAMKQCFRR